MGEIASLLGISLKDLVKVAQWLLLLVAFLAFLLFYALSPLHALILSGLLLILASIAFRVEGDIQRLAIYIGAALMVFGVLGIFLPAVLDGMFSLARQLRQLMAW